MLKQREVKFNKLSTEVHVVTSESQNKDIETPLNTSLSNNLQ